jgi:hypothetical protein
MLKTIPLSYVGSAERKGMEKGRLSQVDVWESVVWALLSRSLLEGLDFDADESAAASTAPRAYEIVFEVQSGAKNGNLRRHPSGIMSLAWLRIL